MPKYVNRSITPADLWIFLQESVQEWQTPEKKYPISEVIQKELTVRIKNLVKIPFSNALKPWNKEEGCMIVHVSLRRLRTYQSGGRSPLYCRQEVARVTFLHLVCNYISLLS